MSVGHYCEEGLRDREVDDMNRVNCRVVPHETNTAFPLIIIVICHISGTIKHIGQIILSS